MSHACRILQCMFMYHLLFKFSLGDLSFPQTFFWRVDCTTLTYIYICMCMYMMMVWKLFVKIKEDYSFKTDNEWIIFVILARILEKNYNSI